MAAGANQSAMPSLFIPVAAMGKCKQINNSNSLCVSDVISLIIHKKLRDFVDAMFPTLTATHVFCHMLFRLYDAHEWQNNNS